MGCRSGGIESTRSGAWAAFRDQLVPFSAAERHLKAARFQGARVSDRCSATGARLLRTAKLLRVALAVKKDEAPGPVDVGLLCPVRVLQCPNAVPEPVKQADRGGRGLSSVAGSGWTRPGDGATIRQPRARDWRRLHA